MEGVSPGDSIVLLGDLSAYVGNDRTTCSGLTWRNGIPDSRPERCLLIGLLCESWTAQTSHNVQA